MLCLWTAKGGSGCSVTAAAVALLAAARTDTLLVDLAGEQPAILGMGPADGVGLAEWLTRAEAPPPDALARLERPAAANLHVLSTDGAGSVPAVPVERVALLAGLLQLDRRLVVVDLGRWDPRWAPVLERASERILVTRPCYLALRSASTGPTPSGVVLITELGRALGPADVAAVVDAPVRVRIPHDPDIARAVDAGLLALRLPRPLHRLRALLPSEPAA